VAEMPKVCATADVVFRRPISPESKINPKVRNTNNFVDQSRGV